jgi:hypothetical protein
VLPKPLSCIQREGSLELPSHIVEEDQVVVGRVGEESGGWDRKNVPIRVNWINDNLEVVVCVEYVV